MPTAQAIRHGQFEDLGSFAAALTDAGYRIEYVEAADRDLAGIPRFGLISVFPEAWRERRMDEDFKHQMVARKRAGTGWSGRISIGSSCVSQPSETSRMSVP